MPKKYFIFLALITASFIIFLPKPTNADAGHLIISQIQTIGTTATDEFVEIYNPTGSQIDLTGYRLSKKTATGTLSNLVASMSGVINPNSYLLLGHTNYVGSVAKDKTYSTSSITDNNVVILYSDAGVNVIDKVGFGTPFESETSPFTTNPTAGQSIRRINNIDTDNNSVDFELLQTALPRNSNNPSPSPSPSPTPTIQPTVDPTTTPTLSPSPSPTPSPSASLSPIPTMSPTPTPSSPPTPTPTPLRTSTPQGHGDNDDDRDEIHLPFGFKCKFERHEFEFKKHHFKYFRFHFERR